jgi:hypothetical protein
MKSILKIMKALSCMAEKTALIVSPSPTNMETEKRGAKEAKPEKII